MVSVKKVGAPIPRRMPNIAHPGILPSENRPRCTPASKQRSQYLYRRYRSKYLTLPSEDGSPIYISPQRTPKAEHRVSTLRTFAK